MIGAVRSVDGMRGEGGDPGDQAGSAPNLCLVVIANQFSETRRRETAKMKQEREDFSSESSFSSFTERFSFFS